MLRTPRLLLLVVLLALPATRAVAARSAADSARPRNVILMISDGCGSASFDLARAVARRPLALDAVHTGWVRTASASDSVTDSAAGATAYAAGVRTVNRRLGRDPSGAPLTSWFAEARQHGRATGLVVTTDVTDATPAAFYAHVHDRRDQDSVAAQLFALRPDVVLGGGRAWFLPRARGGERDDGRDLLAEAQRDGWRTFDRPASVRNVGTRPWLGLFAVHGFNYRLDRDITVEPDLATLARRAVARLARSKRGFVLMIEGSLGDHAAHQNDPAALAREVLEYDATVRAMLDFARRDRHTLVVSLSDHETGGLGFAPPGGDSGLDVSPLRAQRASAPRLAAWIGRTGAPDSVLAARWDGGALTRGERERIANARDDGERARAIAAAASRRAHVRWSTTGHTGRDVPLFAWGPGSRQFRGTLDNATVGRRIATLLGLEAGATAAR